MTLILKINHIQYMLKFFQNQKFFLLDDESTLFVLKKLII